MYNCSLLHMEHPSDKIKTLPAPTTHVPILTKGNAILNSVTTFLGFFGCFALLCFVGFSISVCKWEQKVSFCRLWNVMQYVLLSVWLLCLGVNCASHPCYVCSELTRCRCCLTFHQVTAPQCMSSFYCDRHFHCFLLQPPLNNISGTFLHTPLTHMGTYFS